MSGRRLASVSLDVDNLWSYLKTHGDPGWESRPSYLDTFCPVVLERLDRLGLRITFFLVGADAAREENHAALRALSAAGHEIGNHSHEHEPWLHRYSRAQLEDEIATAEAAIARATGHTPRGFRGPGFSWSPELLEVLAARGYRYDASTFPTYLGPLARAYYFATAKLSAGERERRKALFGGVREGFRPLRPYHWKLASGARLLEIPVTTMPVLKAPFHLSYLLFLSRYSEAMMLAYLRLALGACRAAGVEPSFLLHPLDLLGGDQVPSLAFFPGMDLPHRRKAALFDRVLGILGSECEIVTMGAHAASLESRHDLAARTPALAA